MKDWYRALHPHELGLGCNSNPSPKSSWVSPIQISITNLGLVPQLKPKSKDFNGQAQDTQCLHKLGPFIWVQPSKAQINSHISLGHSITCSSPLQVTTTEELEMRGIAGGPRSWSKLPTLRAASPQRRACTLSPSSRRTVHHHCLHRHGSQPAASPRSLHSNSPKTTMELWRLGNWRDRDMDGLLDDTTSMANPLQSVTIGSRFGRRKEKKVERYRERERERCGVGVGTYAWGWKVGLPAAGFEEGNVGKMVNTTVGIVRYEHGRWKCEDGRYERSGLVR